MEVPDHAALEALRRLEKKEKDAWRAKRLRIIAWPSKASRL